MDLTLSQQPFFHCVIQVKLEGRHPQHMAYDARSGAWWWISGLWGARLCAEQICSQEAEPFGEHQAGMVFLFPLPLDP